MQPPPSVQEECGDGNIDDVVGESVLVSGDRSRFCAMSARFECVDPVSGSAYVDACGGLCRLISSLAMPVPHFTGASGHKSSC